MTGFVSSRQRAKAVARSRGRLLRMGFVVARALVVAGVLVSLAPGWAVSSGSIGRPGGMASAQQAPGDSTAARVLEGRVVRASHGDLEPVRGVQVILHRVGSDRAGPIDSVRTGAGGRFRFRYRPTGVSNAVYLASVTYAGIAYFSTPGATGSGGDADITVFDTSSARIPIRLAGHHVIVGAPDASGMREVEEVFELSNDSSLTLVARGDSAPTFVAHAPTGARELRAAPTPDIAPQALRVVGDRVEVLAPISPGVRQFAFAYRLPPDAFPLSMPIEGATAVLEVLVEESGARVSGAGVGEVEAVSGQGRTFRRFLGQDVQANAVLRIDAPASGADARAHWIPWIAGALGLLMLGAVGWAVRGRQRVATVGSTGAAPVPVPSGAHNSRELLHELASLDASFERNPAPTPAQRAEYERRRGELKARVARALAAERGAG